MVETSPRKRLTRDESRAQTRERLLDAAYTVFVRDGIEATSIEELTEMAGYSRGAFYSNFESKDDLLCVLLERVIKQQQEAMEASIANAKTPEEKIRGSREFYISMACDRQECMFWIAMQLYVLRHPEVRARVVELLRKDRAMVVEFVRRVYEGSALPAPAQPEVLTLGLIALVQGLSISQMVDPEVVDSETMKGALGTFFDRLSGVAPD